MFAQQNTSAHGPSIALLEEGRTSPARPTETTPRLTTEMTVADSGALAGHPQLKAPGQHAINSARTWGVSNGAWSDDEVWLKNCAVCPRRSGYLSVEDMKNRRRCTDRTRRVSKHYRNSSNSSTASSRLTISLLRQRSLVSNTLKLSEATLYSL